MKPYVSQLVLYFARAYQQLPATTAPTRDFGVAAIVTEVEHLDKEDDPVTVKLCVFARDGYPRSEISAEYVGKAPEGEDPRYAPGSCYPGLIETDVACLKVLMDAMDARMEAMEAKLEELP